MVSLREDVPLARNRRQGEEERKRRGTKMVVRTCVLVVLVFQV